MFSLWISHQIGHRCRSLPMSLLLSLHEKNQPYVPAHKQCLINSLLRLTVIYLNEYILYFSVFLYCFSHCSVAWHSLFDSLWARLPNFIYQELSLKGENPKINEFTLKECKVEAVSKQEEHLEGVSKECRNKNLLHKHIKQKPRKVVGSSLLLWKLFSG